VFVIGVVVWFARKYSQDLALTICLFMLLQGYSFVLTALRQSIAVAIVLLFVPQLLKRRYPVFAGGVLLAMQFHSTAVVLFALIPLVHSRVRVRVLLIYLVATPVLVVTAGPVLGYAASSDDRYTSYAAALAGSGGKSGVLLTLAVYLAILGMTMTAMVRGAPSEREEPNSPTLPFLVYSAWLIVPVLGVAFGSTAYLRFSYYFVPFVAVALPGALQRIGNPRTRLLATYGVVVVSAAYFVATSVLRPEWFSVIPYRMS
jgi:hypothetical protein